MRETTAHIWQIFHDRLRHFIHRRIRNENDTEDVLQEVFGKIHAGLGELQAEEKLEAWVFQVTRRAIIDHFRRLAAARRPLPIPRIMADPIPDPSVTAELGSCLGPLLEQLPPQDHEALRLADMDGVDQKDLALKLGLSLTGAKSRVQRARKRLKAALLDCCQIEMDRHGHAIAYTLRQQSCFCS